MFVNFELRLLQLGNVNVFYINSFHRHTARSREVGRNNGECDRIYFLVGGNTLREGVVTCPGAHTSSSALAGFKASYFIGLPAYPASKDVKGIMSGLDYGVRQILLSLNPPIA